MQTKMCQESKSPMVSLKDIGENRKGANENRVKQLNRGLLLQEERNNADLEAQRARQRKQQAYAGDLQQQTRQKEQTLLQMKLEKRREECDFVELSKQLEGAKRELQQQQQQQKQMELQKDYREQKAQIQSDREKLNQEEALAEKRRQQWVREKDEWKRLNECKMAEKLQRQQQKVQVGLEMFAAQERQRKEADAVMIARASANREVSAKQVCSRRHKNMVTAMDLKDHHECVQRERQLRVEEERRSRKDTLALNKEADAAFWEGERVAARTRREARKAMDTVLLQQMEEKRFQDRLRKKYEMDFKIRNQKLLANEDAQFKAYAEGIIDAGEKCKRNTVPIHKAASKGAEQGLGPIYGGLRATYLVSGPRPMPEYVSSTRKDISQLFTSVDKSSHGKLGFIWR